MAKASALLLIRILPFGYTALIWIQSSYFNPSSISYLLTEINMKVLLLIGSGMELFHFFQFGILYIFIIMAVLSFRKLTKRIEYIAILFSLLYGLIDEIHQIYIPFRSYSFLDLLKNTTGVLILSAVIHKSYFSANKSKIGLLLEKVENNFKK
ncbi:VanZ family protein [Neobacillus niacini]|uniref:VanZ family protein n=1 Tax=Neobacillus niacini TaxID=86668 RepID=UPI002FFF41DF